MITPLPGRNRDAEMNCCDFLLMGEGEGWQVGGWCATVIGGPVAFWVPDGRGRNVGLK